MTRAIIIIGAFLVALAGGVIAVVLLVPRLLPDAGAPARNIDRFGGTRLVFVPQEDVGHETLTQVVSVLRRRLRGSGQCQSIISTGSQVVVTVAYCGDAAIDEAGVANIKRMVSAQGVLRLCPLADRQDDAELLKRLAEMRLADVSSEPLWPYEWVRLRYSSQTQWEEARQMLGLPPGMTRERAVMDRPEGHFWYVIHERPTDGRDIEVLLRTDFAEFGGEDFGRVSGSFDSRGEPVIDFRVKPSSSATFARLTRESKDRCLGIILDGELQTAPRVLMEFSEAGQITGYETIAECDQVLHVLENGRLPTPLVLESEAVIAPRRER